MIISYQIFLAMLLPVFLWLTLKHYKNNKDNLYLWQRFSMRLPKVNNPVWFHCASVGEVITAVPLISSYKDKYPNKEILVTTNSVTGANICHQKLSFATHSFLPLDYLTMTDRFLKKIKPEKLIILETEIWPNLFQLCDSLEIPVTIINGRLSKKTTNTNSWFKSIYKKTLNKADKIYCRSEEDAKAYLALGASEQQIKTIGNLKFSGTKPDVSSLENIIDRPFVIAASTHANEEKKIVELWNDSQHNDLLLVIAPRHPERKDDIIKDIKNLANEIAIRSNNQLITNTTDIYLADTFGELPALFKHAEFVIMGGSFVNTGGHNILEPANFGKAILYGPSMENFAAESKYFLEENAATQVNTDKDAISQINKLVIDLDYRNQLGENAKTIMLENNNMTERYLDLL